MKMKAVCEATGLTDRTIRYYIDEELISPAYTENYLGRKTFDFSEGDIQQLNDIAVLRKFGFSISEIREMILHPEQILRIAKELHGRKQNMIGEEQDLLLTLSGLNEENAGSVADLAKYLSMPATDASLPVEEITAEVTSYVVGLFVQPIKRVMKAVFIFPVVCGPVVLAVFILVSEVMDYAYPVFAFGTVIPMLISFLPSIFFWIVPKTKLHVRGKKIARRVLLVMCFLNLVISPVLAGGIVSYSETTDISYYRRLDADCFANRVDFYQDLFPTWPHYFVTEWQPDGQHQTVYLDAHYYYRFIKGFDDTYDIYAEWPLKQDEFYKEVDRVKAVFEEHAPTEGDRRAYYNYVTVQKGSYTCLIIYNGDQPFEAVTNSYDYFIFAYDEQNLRVRYIYCYSLENGYDQPFYLTLDWE